MTQIAFFSPGIDEEYALWLERQIELNRERQFAPAKENSLPKSAFPGEFPYTEEQLLDFDFIP